jgi:hypothetical protein
VPGYKSITRGLIAGALYLPFALGASSGANLAKAGEEQRYPYDPVCAWGRIADGRGMMVRCLKEGEASTFLGPAANGASTKTDAAPKTGETTAVVDPKQEPAKETPAQPAEPSAPEKELTVGTIGPIVVDSGELPLAVKKLSEPKDKYMDCVRKNGGLQADPAEVQLRFLVRERGRAEGVSVTKRKGMSAEAARCIADVVDRRYVGYPAAPIVGATLPIVVSYKSK